jgi:simple sugar transport system permease protein
MERCGLPDDQNFSQGGLAASSSGYAKEVPAFSGMTMHAGILFGLIAAVIIYLILYRSKWGYKITLIGDNVRAARYVASTSLPTPFWFSWFLAHWLGGRMTEVSGVVHRLQERISNLLRLLRRDVAWLAKLNPLPPSLFPFFLERFWWPAVRYSPRGSLS